MSFLMLSTTGVILLAGLTSAAVLLLFFLKLRHRRVVVGSSLLWNRILDEQQTNSLIEKLRRLISLLLTMTIALLIALAIGRPQFNAVASERQPLIVVLDTSPSMEARSADGATRWDHARDLAEELLTRSTPAAGYMVADTAGRIHTQVTTRLGDALDALVSMHPFPGEQRFPGLPSPDGDVYYVTDGVAGLAIPDGVRQVSVFEPADNVAITAFQIRVDPSSPSGYRAFIEVTNYSQTTKTVPVLLSGAASQREAWRLDLAPGQAWQNETDLADFSGGGLRIRIDAEGDALELDNTAYAYLPGEKSTRVDLITPRRGTYLETLLSLSPRVNLRVVEPSAYADDPEADVFVFDGYLPPAAPANPSLVFGPGEVSWLPSSSGTAYDQAIVSWDGDHPVMANVPVYDIEIREAAVVDPSGWTTVAASADTPLILVSEGSVRRVFIGFSLDKSDFAFHLGFPILVENVFAWASGEALAQQTGLGDVTIPAEVETVTTLENVAVPTVQRFGQTIVEATKPQLLTASVQGRRMRVAANLLDPSVSNVNGTDLPASNASTVTAPGGGELWVYMLVAAALLIAMEFLTYHRRITL